MSIIVPQVFISSTSEFAGERALLKNEIDSLQDIRFNAYVYEADAAGGDSPESRLRTVIEQSEIFLLILGDRFGSEYPGKQTSIVEWEYDYAISNGKDLKGYVKDPLSPDIDVRQKAFLSRVGSFRGGSWLRKFTGAQQLILTAIADIRKWATDGRTLWLSEQQDRVRWKDRIAMAGSALVATATTILVGVGALIGLPFERLAIVFGTGASMYAGMFVLLKSKIL